MEPGREDREHLVNRIDRLKLVFRASMEPGREDREHGRDLAQCDTRGDASMEPGREDREHNT